MLAANVNPPPHPKQQMDDHLMGAANCSGEPVYAQVNRDQKRQQRALGPLQLVGGNGGQGGDGGTSAAAADRNHGSESFVS